jgi:cyanate permease
VLTIRTVLLLVVADAGVFAQYAALTTWLPTYYYEARDMSLTEAGFVTGLLPLVGVLAVLLGGFLPLKIHPERLFFIVPGVLIGLGSLGSFLIGDPVGIYASIIILGIGAWSYAPTLLTLPMRLPGMTPEKVAVVWGFFVTISGTGMFVAPLVVGAARDVAGSFIPGFAIFAVGAWFLLLAGLALPRVRRAPASDTQED